MTPQGPGVPSPEAGTTGQRSATASTPSRAGFQTLLVCAPCDGSGLVSWWVPYSDSPQVALCPCCEGAGAFLAVAA